MAGQGCVLPLSIRVGSPFLATHVLVGVSPENSRPHMVCDVAPSLPVGRGWGGTSLMQPVSLRSHRRVPELDTNALTAWITLRIVSDGLRSRERTGRG